MFPDFLTWLSNLGNTQTIPRSQTSEDIAKAMKLTTTVSPNFVNEQQVKLPKGLGRNPDIPKKPMTPEVQKAIEDAAREFGVIPELMFDIGYGEGGFRADARNESPEGIKAGIPTGLFQFTPGTWDTVANYASNPNSSLKNWDRSFKREDPVANARAAAYLIKQGQLAKWAASVGNWGRFYNDQELAPYFTQSPGWQGLPKK